MTIQIVDISQLGIVCASDSAISFMQNGKVRRQEKWQKLLVLHRINCVIGYYGQALIRGQRMPNWINSFARRSRSTSLDEFAIEFRDELNQSVVFPTGSDGTGFHLSGYTLVDKKPAPSFYHIWNHDGVASNYSVTGTGFRLSRDFQDRDALDYYPGRLAELFSQRWSLVYRNGALKPYTDLAESLYSFTKRLWSKDLREEPSDLTDWAWHYRFQLETLKLMYRYVLKVSLPPVGRAIDVITIDPNGKIERLSTHP